MSISIVVVVGLPCWQNEKRRREGLGLGRVTQEGIRERELKNKLYGVSAGLGV